METTTEMNQEQQEVQNKVLQLRDKAEAIAIDSSESYIHAGELLKMAKQRQKSVEEHFGPPKQAAYDAYKKVSELYNKAADPLKAIERVLKPRIAAYKIKMDQVADEARRKAQEEALKAAEEERLAQARHLELQGKKEAATAILDVPVVVPQVHVEAAPKLDGISTRQNWSAEVTDLKALCKAIGSGKVEIEYVEPNFKVLNSRAKSLKSNAFNKIPGVEAVSKPVVSSRT